jgi:hypothetical protein
MRDTQYAASIAYDPAYQGFVMPDAVYTVIRSLIVNGGLSDLARHQSTPAPAPAPNDADAPDHRAEDGAARDHVPKRRRTVPVQRNVHTQTDDLPRRTAETQTMGAPSACVGVSALPPVPPPLPPPPPPPPPAAGSAWLAPDPSPPIGPTGDVDAAEKGGEREEEWFDAASAASARAPSPPPLRAGSDAGSRPSLRTGSRPLECKLLTEPILLSGRPPPPTSIARMEAAACNQPDADHGRDGDRPGPSRRGPRVDALWLLQFPGGGATALAAAGRLARGAVDAAALAVRRRTGRTHPLPVGDRHGAHRRPASRFRAPMLRTEPRTGQGVHRDAEQRPTRDAVALDFRGRDGAMRFAGDGARSRVIGVRVPVPSAIRVARTGVKKTLTPSARRAGAW